MKKTVFTLLGVIATAIGALGFIMLPSLISLKVVEYIEDERVKAILLLSSYLVGIPLNLGIAIYFSAKVAERREENTAQEKASPRIILVPIKLVIMVILLIWPAIALQSFGDKIQLIGVVVWIVLVFTILICVNEKKPKTKKEKKES